jgi:hypothetical protein
MSPPEHPLPPLVEDQIVRVADMLPWVRHRRFVRCTIVGPTPALLSSCHIEGSTWLGVGPKSFIVVADPSNQSKLPKGTIVFLECQFISCEFQNFKVVGSKAQIESIKTAFGPIR